MKFPMILQKIKIPQKVTQTASKVLFKLAKAKPDIYIIGGIVVGGGAIVMAVVDTWKSKDKIQNSLDTIKANAVSESDDKPVEVVKADVSKAKKQLAADLFKTYWKSAVLGGASVVLILHGKKLMKQQIIELSAMYAALLESYRRYRANVINEYGADKDQEFLYGVKMVDAVDAETGEVTKRAVPSEKISGGSIYARWLTPGDFDPVSKKWLWQNPIYRENRQNFEAILRSIQSECNDLLRARGYLFLNDVYKKLGFPQTEAGQHVGWVRGGMLNGIKGDDFVDFGIFDDYYNGKYQLPVNKLFLDPASNQRYPLVDFNVICIDGIWDNIYEYDNWSMVSYQQRKEPGYFGSKEDLDRWYQQQTLFEQV